MRIFETCGPLCLARASRSGIRASLGLAAGLALLSTACSSGDDSGGGALFTLRSTSQAVAPSTPIVVSERWLAYLADEATTANTVLMTSNSDFNGDGDASDEVAVVIDMVLRDETNLGVAANEVHILGSDVYVVVEESDDGRDWDGDTVADDLVLLHWSKLSALAFVDLIEDDGAVTAAVVNGRLYYSSDNSPSGIETSLRFLSSAAPTLPTVVNTSDVDAGSAQLNHEVGLLGADGDILFCLLDEQAMSADLNFLIDPTLLTRAYDSDTGDSFVLALLDTGSTANLLYNTGIAVSGKDVPFRARALPGANWLVATLRDESAYGQLTGGQGGFNSDAEAFAELPATWDASTACVDDIDVSDDVLCWLSLNAWIADPVGDRVANTGLAGIETQSAGGAVAITVGSPVVVATLQRETDQAACDLNNDADTADVVVRWAEAANPQTFFFGDSQEIVATSTVEGDETGLFELENTLIALVDEAADSRDHDNDPGNDRDALLAALDPAAGLSAAWTYDHSLDVDELYIDTDYLVREPDSQRLLLSISEALLTGSQNPGDADQLDVIPAIARFVTDVDFGVSNVALAPTRGGLVSSDGIFFYRASEAADNRNWNEDGDTTDIVLIRTSESTGFSAYVADIASLDRPAVETGDGSQSVVAGAVLVNEAAAGADFNGDGDMNDFTVRYFRF